MIHAEMYVVSFIIFLKIYCLVGAGVAARQEGHRRQVGARQLDCVQRHLAQPWLGILQAVSHDVKNQFRTLVRVLLEILYVPHTFKKGLTPHILQ